MSSDGPEVAGTGYLRSCRVEGAAAFGRGHKSLTGGVPSTQLLAGPTWPVVNWLLWWSLVRAGESVRAQQLRQASLQQLVIGGFGEYFDSFTGELLDANDQSWTAAVALDWLASQGCGALRRTATVLQPSRYEAVRGGHTDWAETVESA